MPLQTPLAGRRNGYPSAPLAFPTQLGASGPMRGCEIPDLILCCHRCLSFQVVFCGAYAYERVQAHSDRKLQEAAQRGRRGTPRQRPLEYSPHSAMTHIVDAQQVGPARTCLQNAQRIQSHTSELSYFRTSINYRRCRNPTRALQKHDERTKNEVRGKYSVPVRAANHESESTCTTTSLRACDSTNTLPF